MTLVEDLTTEVAIVGSGVAGALVATELAEAGLQVTVLEAGPRVTRAELLDNYFKAPIRTPDSPYPNTDYAPIPARLNSEDYCIETGPDKFEPRYLRLVGGTTWHWEGACIRFLPEDFQMNSLYGLAEDWPIGYSDLEPWYGRAEHELGVAGNSDEDLGSPRSTDYPMPGMPLSYLDLQVAKALENTDYKTLLTPDARNTMSWNDRPRCCGSGSCVPICPSAAKYDATVHVEKAEAAGARILDQRVVYKVEIDTDHNISGLFYKKPDGSEGRLRATTYVIAAHGIETPKLLLMSANEGSPNGVANSSDQVGRNLMDHPYKLSWALTKEPLWPYRGPIRLSAINSTRKGSWRKDRPSARVCVDSAAFNWPAGGPTTTVRELIASGMRGKELESAIFDQTSRQIALETLTEQLPEPYNRIVPDFDNRDNIGLPKPKVYFRLDDYTAAGMAEAERVHDFIFEKIGTTETFHRKDASPGAHIMGTYRMGEDPKRSVVDVDLRSHDHANLFLLGSGVFPTGAAANPTLTIAALSLKAVSAIKSSVTQ